MVELNFKWADSMGDFQSGESLALNGVRVANYGWNSMRNRDSEEDRLLNYSGTILLPGLSGKASHVYGESEEQIKAKIEGIVTRWFDRVLAENRGG